MPLVVAEEPELLEEYNMSIRIIDNKKLDMTEDEWKMYNQICRSYDRQSFKGEELFKDLFETDDNGTVVYLRPPSNRHTSMEVIFFMSNLMTHQHLRIMHNQVDNLCKEVKEKIEKMITSTM
jgi:hypothetical protein